MTWDISDLGHNVYNSPCAAVNACNTNSLCSTFNFITNSVSIIMANKDFGEMTIPQLKGELRSRNAKLNGRKADLVERYVTMCGR